MGLLKTVPGFHPAGALRATKFVPDKFVKPTVAMRQWLRSPHHRQIKNPAEAGLFIWRRGWDSNPRRATNPCWFSSQSSRAIAQLYTHKYKDNNHLEKGLILCVVRLSRKCN